MRRIFLFLLSLAISTSALALNGQRVVKQGVLPHTGQAVVVAEGDLEPRSIGSYTVHLYAKNTAYPHDHFVGGIVHTRNGVVDALRFEDIDGDSKPEIVVIIRYTGSGGFISADAFAPHGTTLRLVSSVAGLPSNQDPIQALIQTLRHKHSKRH